ncbi:MAG: RibD family protein, partial [Luteimonas sp.]
AHGPVRPICEHASNVTYAVAPRALSPAACNASTSACAPPARWRARSGAILTGAGTVLMDDPLLTVRLDDNTPGHERDFVPPLRVILDPGLATIARGRIREGDAPTLYVHAADARMPRGIDAQHAPVPVHAGLFDLHAVLALLAERQVNEVQVEAGATLAGAFLAAGLVDELLLYIAPIILGERARPMFDGLPIDTMSERLSMRIVETRRIGQDVRLLLRPRHEESPPPMPAAEPPRSDTDAP